ncbi:uncharacterized protein PHACADRAFT_115500 [Phanerochaete carnosa HHB-10118-sp]|uniref:Uncharacterized protein n=1 Tax=Phanerochaete carnosa (strain HHB-10118-sp) TaxID=650164 RepID=K5WKW7_PHACS|nr:uncharacterized protein PHACADRAFT_115500 [Phanerochaete carnosa HHB-10118-sp]EKM60065.1 hypothetical protein PHACADRAFT_115500 [Phanerochaete carnosa HHB-10118-sp]
MHRHRHLTPLYIGAPTSNNRVYILDENLQPLPIGCIGTMWAAGACVTSGYVNKLELTRDRYRPDPFCNDGMTFDTGDLGRWNEHGELEHFGRLDDQVKVKGFRVELDGVAAVMEAHPSVTRAVSLLIGTDFWGTVSPSSAPIDELKTFIERRLPYYSVPSRYISLEMFPMTSNGKADKRSLRKGAVCSASLLLTEHKLQAKEGTCPIFR